MALLRTDLQRLAESRVREAAALLAAGEWSGAYYLAGYAVELAFKACIAKATVAEEFPDLQRVKEAHVHKLDELLKLAGLTTEFGQACGADQTGKLVLNWDVVKRWKEVARYQEWSESEARALYNAITDPTYGMLPWIRSRW